ncbi:heavy metal translocating P-type ATPase metal-binding domain-containing protein [Cerasicoccus arenae]|nr:heavy metal translocating P-type ATPase metal-binding domain-containing protein [Cerasicoccus arenae]
MGNSGQLITTQVQSLRRSCQHCGTPFTSRNNDVAFCCMGCESVYQLIRDQGFDEYYARKSGVTDPILEAPFTELNWQWLHELVIQAETMPSENASAEFSVSGLSCNGCSWLAQQVITRQSGILDSKIHGAPSHIELTWLRGTDLVKLAMELQRFGFLLHPLDAPPRPARTPLIFGAVFVGSALLFQLPRFLGATDGFAFARIFDLMSTLLGGLAVLMASHFIVRWQAYQQQLKS